MSEAKKSEYFSRGDRLYRARDGFREYCTVIDLVDSQNDELSAYRIKPDGYIDDVPEAWAFQVPVYLFHGEDRVWFPVEGLKEKSDLRAYTKEEVLEELLNHMKAQIGYWAKVDNQDTEEKLNGLVFSILNIFDGTTMALPAFDLVLSTHPGDKEFFIEEGQNWYEHGMAINDEVSLHEMWCR